jgi:serine O-acetyltransferase
MTSENNTSGSYRLGKAIKSLTDPTSYELVFHQQRAGQDMVSVTAIAELVELSKAILFPGFFGNTSVNSSNLKFYIGVNIDKLYALLKTQIHRGFCFSCATATTECTDCFKDADQIALAFIEQLSEIREKLAKDAQSTFKYDPAAKSLGEVILAYPSIKALTHYRIANALYKLDVPIIPRMITEMAHSETGVDIHPGATIGEYFTIDHGTGIVIGETCIIGNNVRLYQGVTLGAKSFPTDEKGEPMRIARHPIVEDNVTIYSGATILGRVTIGRGSVVGGNVWVTYSLPPNSQVVQRKAREALFYDGGGI